MKVFVAGISYKTAPVALREQLAVSPAQLRCSACRVKIGAGLDEVVLLSTCNRVEVYGVASKVNGNVHGLFQHLSAAPRDFSPHLYVHEGDEAVKHLFSVAGGLDSMVLGETEITGQLKNAYTAAQESRLTGRILNRAFQTALQTAKEIRSTTQVGRGATSVGSVAVELAGNIFGGELPSKTIMIVGAGKMGETCVRHLAKKGAQSVLVTNRSFEKAENLAGEFGGTAVRMERFLEAMVTADIVVCSTGSPQTILGPAQIRPVMAARRNRPLFLIDIAVPRDIDPAVQELENVFLYNIDHLENLMRENLRLREAELARCREIIERRTSALMERFTPARSGSTSRRAASAPEWALSKTLCPA